jgi:CheY-like chemotaxis protein
MAFQAIPHLAFRRGFRQFESMTQPLALILYERLLPGTQLVNRLQDLNYRVQTVTDPNQLVECAEQTRPMLVLADLDSQRPQVCAAIGRLRQAEQTRHLPVVAFSAGTDPSAQTDAQTAGATLVVGDTAILNHLPQILEQALQVE